MLLDIGTVLPFSPPRVKQLWWYCAWLSSDMAMFMLSRYRGYRWISAITTHFPLSQLAIAWWYLGSPTIAIIAISPISPGSCSDDVAKWPSSVILTVKRIGILLLWQKNDCDFYVSWCWENIIHDELPIFQPSHNRRVDLETCLPVHHFDPEFLSLLPDIPATFCTIKSLKMFFLLWLPATENGKKNVLSSECWGGSSINVKCPLKCTSSVCINVLVQTRGNHFWRLFCFCASWVEL